MIRHLRLGYQPLFRKCARTRELGRDRALRRLYPSVFPFISTWRSLRGLNNKIKLSPKFLLRLSQLVLLPLSCSCKTFSTYLEILILNLIQLMCSCVLFNRPGDTWLFIENSAKSLPGQTEIQQVDSIFHQADH